MNDILNDFDIVTSEHNDDLLLIIDNIDNKQITENNVINIGNDSIYISNPKRDNIYLSDNNKDFIDEIRAKESIIVLEVIPDNKPNASKKTNITYIAKVNLLT